MTTTNARPAFSPLASLFFFVRACGPGKASAAALLAALVPTLACHRADPRTSCAVPLDLNGIDGIDGRSFADEIGTIQTRSATGAVDASSDFFRSLGTNGRRCVSCHVPSQGWTLTPRHLQDVFDRTDGGTCDDALGLGAVFRPVDGATSPSADVSTADARRAAYRLLLSRGLIRIGLPIPPSAEFDLVSVDDPYHFASAAQLSLFRRPLPTTNLKFDSTVMWDGREVVAGAPVSADLASQANTAVVTHAQGATPLTDAQRGALVAFEVALATAQSTIQGVGALDADGASGGPRQILAQPFHIGINDNFGDDGTPFSPIIFSLYDAWETSADAQRRSIARGQALFDGRPIQITGVSGINDEDKFGRPAELRGTCGTCHDTPGGGNHSVVAPLNIGIADESRRSPDVPLYTLRNKATGEIVRVTDPGRGLIDGQWKHIGRFKGPMLRDLAIRAPYFHDGSAARLEDVVAFYDGRFGIGFTEQEKADLVAFLRAL